MPYVIPVHPLIRLALVPALLAGPLALRLGVKHAGQASSSPPALSASAVADLLGDHYGALELVADSVAAAQPADDAGPSELAQVTARNLAIRIQAVAGDYERLSVAMTAWNYETGLSLWMRLAIAQAGLEMLEEDAVRLGADPETGPADLRALADQLSGVLELGRVAGREASRVFAPPPASPRSGLTRS